MAVDRDAIRELARTALLHAIAAKGKPDVADVQAISRGHGPDGLMTAMLMWLDTAIGLQGITPGSAPVSLSFMPHETREHQGAADVPAEVRWAGQLMAARAADDEDGFWALVGSIPPQGYETGRYVAVLLSSCAATCDLFSGGEG